MGNFKIQSRSRPICKGNDKKIRRNYFRTVANEDFFLHLMSEVFKV